MAYIFVYMDVNRHWTFKATSEVYDIIDGDRYEWFW